MSTPSVAVASRNRDLAAEAPPRLVSDQLINIFFQEWAPLYPVVHRPTILKAYEDYLSDPESLGDRRYVVPQLNLIFGIAALSSTVGYLRTALRFYFITNLIFSSLEQTRTQRSLSEIGVRLLIFCRTMCRLRPCNAISLRKYTAAQRRITRVYHDIEALLSACVISLGFIRARPISRRIP